MQRPDRAIAICALLAVPLLFGACDDPKSKTKTQASATAPTTATDPPPPPKPKTMPELLVDSLGPYLGGRRVDMKNEKWPERMASIIKELPIEGKPVTLIAEKKAQTPHVAATVNALGEAGAPKVLIKTDGRDDLPKEISVTPPGRVGAPPGCSIAAMVMKDFSTAVWPFKGGLGKRQRKGHAGPDLSMTSDALRKDLSVCDSTMAFFSADDTLLWEMAYNIGATIIQADEKKRIDTLVLLPEAPVAGRPVSLKK